MKKLQFKYNTEGMFKVNPLRKRQFSGIIVGLILGVVLFCFYTLNSSEEYISIGPMNSGHDDLSCITCHADAKGTLLQQIQSNISYAVGVRKSNVDFGTKDVTSDNCLQCHDRPNDRHPIYRFSEPRFKDAIKQVDATTCITCHSEHHGARVTIDTRNFCKNCHQELVVEDDPLDVDHETLIRNQNWSTCLQCHDFHGNHKYDVPTKIKDTISIKKIATYFDGGKDPYGNNKKHKGLTEAEWLNSLIK